MSPLLRLSIFTFFGAAIVSESLFKIRWAECAHRGAGAHIIAPTKRRIIPRIVIYSRCVRVKSKKNGYFCTKNQRAKVIIFFVLKFINRIINVTLLVFCILLALNSMARETKSWCVVIDAGHGGKDPGTVSGRVYEKSINLAVALELGRELKRRLPDINIVYTRADDRFVELSERSRIANRAAADLFVSIHTNSNPNKNARGTETFVMGVDKSSANLSVAMRENGVVSLESDYQTKYEGYDPKNSESLIMFSLMQYGYQTQSLALARMVEANYGTHSRGVKQAGFLVLWRTAMPSILTEIGFLSNAQDMAGMTSESGQNRLARALADAVESYVEQNPKESILPLSPKAENSPPVKPQSQTKPTTKPQTKPEAKPEAKPAVKTESKNEPQVKSDNKPAQGKRYPKNDIRYAVQIKTSSEKIERNYDNFGSWIMEVRERKKENIYKYFVGELISYKDALFLQDKLRKIYHDAFVIAFCGEEQISVNEAKKITEKL